VRPNVPVQLRRETTVRCNRLLDRILEDSTRISFR
jgi:hypothetical protein